MGIIHRYVTRDFLVSFFMTLSIFTFIMCAAAIVKAIDLMARGVSGVLIFKLFAYNIPYILAFSIPVSFMTTALLLFSRLSFDGEITAMKASGVSMWQIVSPVILLAAVASAVCIYLNNTAAPNSRYARRVLLTELGAEEPVNLLEEGRFVKEFPGLMIYVGKKKRHRVQDIVVYELGSEGIKQSVRAQSGEIRSDPARNEMMIDLYNVRIDRPDPEHPLDPSKNRSITAERYPVKLDLSELAGKSTVSKGTKDLSFRELVDILKHTRKYYPDADPDALSRQRLRKLFEANKRLALAMSCFAFGFLAIPLGMKSRRKESSVGVAISLACVFVFYAVIVVAESLTTYPHLRPEMLVWLPVLGAQLGGILLIQRIN